MKKVFFFGDSNTYGYDPAGYMGGRYPRKSRWTTILADNLAGEWETAADGMPGRMIPEPGRGTQFFMDAVKAEMPMDLLAVMLGTNDLLNMRSPDASKVAGKMDKLIGTVAGTISAQVLLIAPPQIRFTDPSCTEPFVRGSDFYAQKCRVESQLLARYYKEIAAKYGIFAADASSWKLDFAFDGVHLSEKGNTLFAGEMAKILQEISMNG